MLKNKMKKKPLIPTFGCDPELMLIHASSGRIVNAVRAIKRNKNNPIDLGSGIKAYNDNVLVETSMPPATSPEGMLIMIREALKRMQSKLCNRTFRLLPKASHMYDDLPPKPDDELVYKWLNDEVPSDAVAEEWQVGCNPNWDGYAVAQRKQRPFQDGLRSGSFHIHIGNSNYHDKEEELLLTSQSKVMAIRLMDIFVGCPSIIFDKDASSPARRKLYGMAGEFRETRYGIEYRVLGNYCLRTPILTKLVFELAAHAMKILERGEGPSLLAAIGSSKVQTAINENDPHLASKIIHDACMPARLSDRIHSIPAFTPDMYESWAI